FWEHIRNFPLVFIQDPGDLTKGTLQPGSFLTGNQWITLHPTCNSTGERTRQIDTCLRLLESEKIIPNWRNELCPVVTRFDGHRYFSIERAALPFFGIKCYCLHMNGFVKKNGKDWLWISKRSKKKKSFTGVMDNMVAAAQVAGGNCKQNLIQKAYEKANIPRELAEKAVSSGHVSYVQCIGMKYKRDVVYVYDLELPPDFLPFSNDGDVENFQLVSLANVAKMICTPGQYKLNSSLVVIDFLFRHGHINPMQTGYIHLHESLHSGDNH
ncbi:hypothetical protein KC19_1G220800, partial [Ceratodon purpureus]